MNPSNGISPLRTGFTLILLAGCSLALVGRIGFLQIVQHQDYVQQADGNHWAKQTVQAHRGAVMDRDGNPLAVSTSRWEVSLDPSKFKSPLLRERAIAAVAASLGVSPPEVEGKLLVQPAPAVARVQSAQDVPLPASAAASSGYSGPVVISGNLDYQQGKSLAEKGIPGIIIQERTDRIYPESSLAAQVLGLLGRDQAGLSGIEMDYNRELAGAPGTLVYERDSLGNPIPLGFRSKVQPEVGGNLVLTIDRFIQRTIERELQAAIERHKAAGGTIIVMEPNTGAILGMASRPTFDLRNPNLSDPKSVDLMRNRAITDLYEPGSTFKILTMSMAINEGLVTPETTYMDAGPVTKYGPAIETWDFRHYGTQTMNQLLMTSNNVGAVWLAEKVGTKRFYEYANKFGIGQPTAIGLSGEAAGQLRTPADKDDWWPIDLATNAFGQGLSVTPLQMVTAISSVVNGGTLMRPFLVQRIETPDATRTFQPTSVRRVVSEDTARTMRAMMNTVAEQGGTTSYNVPGFRIGVKTGTATIPGVGGYRTDATIASIVGFAPYERPRAVVLVKLDAPKDSPWGSVVAGPVFSNVVRELMVYWRIPPTDSAMVGKLR